MVQGIAYMIFIPTQPEVTPKKEQPLWQIPASPGKGEACGDCGRVGLARHADDWPYQGEMHELSF